MFKEKNLAFQVASQRNDGISPCFLVSVCLFGYFNPLSTIYGINVLTIVLVVTEKTQTLPNGML
jgi:hypothetical protein